jgi:predicted RNA-binding protein with RPS1 domain
MGKYEKDKIVIGCVTGIEPYGIFIDLEDNYDGLIHISEISNDFVRNVADYADIGEFLKVKVLDVNEKSHHVKLSIKDINYRSEKDAKIHETAHGFDTLKKNLDVWIKDKISELEKDKK